MPPQPPSTLDYWRLQSYGYPNPFSNSKNAKDAWQVFLMFINQSDGSYSSLRAHWVSTKGKKASGVESWKAAFEEFGLLYVLSGSSQITITPAGRQFYAAAVSENEEEFLWIGLNLLLRYPLQGPPRGKPRNEARGSSDLLLYRFVYSATRDLGDYLWWTELTRVLCRVYSTSEAKDAVDAVRYLREHPNEIESFQALPAASSDSFYNLMNMVFVHAGMNHVLLLQDNTTEHYPVPEKKRKHLVNRGYLNLINAALGDLPHDGECANTAPYIDRLPVAPTFEDEEAYFTYLGAQVTPYSSLADLSLPQTLSLSGDTVFVLKEGKHFTLVHAADNHLVIRGQVHAMCRIARNHRMILSTDLAWSYLVTEKAAADSGEILITLRRARPIVNVEPIQAMLGGTDV